MEEENSKFTELLSPQKIIYEPPLNLSQISPNLSAIPLNKVQLLPPISTLIPNVLQKKCLPSSQPPIFSTKSTENQSEIVWKKKLNNLFPDVLYSEYVDGVIFPSTPLPSILCICMGMPEILMRNYEENNNENCFFWVNDRGKWFKLSVDINFPHVGDIYAFTLVNTMVKQGIYVHILEKALARVTGSYENLFLGVSLRKTLKMILGVPIEKVQLDKNTEETIKNGFYRGFLIFFEGSKETFKNDGFLMIDYQESEGIFKLKAANKTIAAKICDNFPEYIKDSDEKTSTVSLDLEGISKIAKRVNICKIHENYFHTWAEIKVFQSFFRISSEISLHLYISVSFTEKTSFRFFLSRSKENENGSKPEIIHAKFMNKKNYIIEEFLEGGDYSILIEFSRVSNGVISLYSSNSALSLQEKSINPKDFLAYQELIFKDMAVFRASPSKQIFNYLNQPKIRCFSDVICGCLYVYILNQSRKTLKEKMMVDREKTLKLQENISLDFIEIAPNADLLLIFKFDGTAKDSTSYEKYEISHDFSVENSKMPILEDNSVMGFNSVCHNTEIPKKNLIMPNENQGGKPELIKILREQGKKSKRTWQKKDIEVFCYTIIHETGVAFLYTNYTYFPYEENVVFELRNLGIVNNHEENVVRFQLEPYSEFLLFLERKDLDKEFAFKTRNYYKYYPEK